MALKTFVKVSGINNLSDARYCAGMGVNQLGFNIEPDHENYTDPKSFKELADWVSGVEFVGEIEKHSNIQELTSEYELNAIQVSDLSLISAAYSTGKPVIFYTTSIDHAQQAYDQHSGALSYILLEDASADQTSIKHLASQIDLLIGAGLETEKLGEMLDSLQPKGIALKGGKEIRPGYKDFDEMADILEELDADEFA